MDFMPFLELLDETLDINSTESYDLSMQICYNYLSFSVLDTLRNKFVMLRSYENEAGSLYDARSIGNLISMDDFLTRRFRRTCIITPSAKSTLIPSPLYDESRKENFYLFNHSDQGNQTILVNELREPDAFLLFTITSDLYDLLKQYYPHASPVHHLKPLLKFYSVNKRLTGNNSVNVHIERGYLSIIVFDQNSLKFCNTFNYQTGSDLRYYILYVIKRLGLNGDENLFFSGMISKNDESIYGLSDYLKNIKFALPTGNHTLSYVFNETEIHRFMNLFIASGCE
jgi:hypothetical protein